MSAGDDPEELEYDQYRFEISGAEFCGRMDKALSLLCADLSRARLQKLIADGQVKVNGEVCALSSKKLVQGDVVEIAVPPPQEAVPRPENIALDILYEDEDLLVINKQAGMVVHPGAGNWSGTLVNALLHHCGDSLSGIGGVIRPGIVHRLDKDTSGLMVVAKNDAAHQALSAQLADRSLSRVYKALVFRVPVPIKGVVDQPIGRHSSSRLKMTVTRKQGREARTFYHVQENFADAAALVECQLESGRTHQIRVHMEYIKHPILGDPLYGPQRTALESALKKAGFTQDSLYILDFPRQALHAEAIRFIHPANGEEMEFTAAPPEDFVKLLKLLRK